MGVMHGRGHDKAGCGVVVGCWRATAGVVAVGHGWWWLGQLFVKGTGHLRRGQYRGVREKGEAMRKGASVRELYAGEWLPYANTCHNSVSPRARPTALSFGLAHIHARVSVEDVCPKGTGCN